MEYRREIDGLRTLAVLPVILFHAGFETFSGGFVGVDVFFVISGYLITSIILTELEKGKFSIVNFYERRARRILPALFFVMLVCSAFAWCWLLPSDMQDFSQSLVAVSVFASNILFWGESGYFDTAAELKPLLHTWSLAVEEQYYVIFPVFLMVFWRFGQRWILILLAIIFAVSLTAAQWGSLAQPTATFFLLPTRIWEIMIGAFAAFYLSKANHKEFTRGIGEVGGWLGLGLILYSVFAFSKATPFPGLYTLAPTLGTVLIILFAKQETSVGSFIGNKVFVAIGLISYSAYLWHQPLFVFARHRSLSEPGNLMLIVLSLLALVLAYLSWRYVEAPFRDREKFNRKQIFSLSLVFSSFFIAFGLIGYFNDGYRSRLPERISNIEKAALDKNPRREECHFSARTFPSPENYCVLGKGSIAGMMFGDSHADALAFPLSKDLTKINIALLSATYSGCPPVENLYRVDKREDHRCYEFNRQSFDYALKTPSIQYVILLGRWTSSYTGKYFDNKEGGVESKDTLAFDLVSSEGLKTLHEESERRTIIKDQYLKSVKRLLEARKKVFLIYPIPEVGFNVPKHKTRVEWITNSKFEVTTSYDVFLERNKEIIEAFDSLGDLPNLIRIRPDKLLCDSVVKGRCVTEIDGQILYYDDNHLSNSGAKILSEIIIKNLENTY